MRQSGIVHVDMMGAVVGQNAVAIVFTKPGTLSKDTPPGTKPVDTVLAPQIVRISYDNRVGSVQGAAGSAPILNADVYAEAGADIDEGYTFSHAGNSFRVVDVIPVASGVVAKCQAIG